MGSMIALLPNLPLIFIPGSDNFPALTVVRGSDGSTPVTDATGTVTLYDEYAQAVPGATSVALSNSSNVYTGTFPNASFNPPPGRNYRIKFVLTSAALGGAKRTWWFDAWVAEENMA